MIEFKHSLANSRYDLSKQPFLAPLAKERLLKVEDVFQAQNNNIWRLKCVDPKLVMNNRDLITSLNTSQKSPDNETKTIVIKVLKLLLDQFTPLEI